MRIKLFVLALFAVLSACNRVPAQDTPPVAIVPAPEADASGAAEPAPEEDDAIEPLCSRACEHWVALRFQTPVGWAQVPDVQKPAAMELLVRQKELNRADCEERCARARKPDLAKCLLRSQSADDAVTCAAR